MLPSILVKQLQEGLNDYIETTFPMTTPGFKGSVARMLKETPDSVFHEPYFSVRLPFRVAYDVTDLFTSIHTTYKPYVHQQKAFARLTGEDGRSTLIATGTGSGKTECFIYPILEYCYKHRGEKGIKALIIYPMNALASDQAKRIAELVHNSPELKNNVSVGMYVGGHEDSPSRVMSEDRVITDHETMLSSPPDILLTNYKMLDYLLVRPKDAALWKDNNPDTLKYIAVDELHTFDGAQGTDLACLLRRLKSRLFIQPGFLCCIGTSATMGDKDSALNILNYAEEIFGEEFEDDAVITEDRLSAFEFFRGYEITDFTFPSNEDIEKLKILIAEGDLEKYLEAAARVWIEPDIPDIKTDQARVAIGQVLMNHSFMQTMIEYGAGKYMQSSQLCKELSIKYPELKKLSDPSAAIDALIALISHARISSVGKNRPFLTVQVHLWMREWRRLLAKVSKDEITYALASDLNEQQAKQYLPVVNCRDCGETGWVSIVNERGNATLVSLETFYNLYFNQDSKVIMLYPYEDDTVPFDMGAARLCTNCLQLDIGENATKQCSSCGSENIPVMFPLKTKTTRSNRGFSCPHCGSHTGLSIMGLRSATAISASISQMFASKFNDDKKTLAFSDNVQDAAHRAGFFSSRTWKFGIRSAIQRFVLEGGDGLSLNEFSKKCIDYWHSKYSDEEFVSRFIAPNMTWMRAYEKMKNEGVLSSGKDAKKLIIGIENRLSYEIMLEYGLMSRTGRTLAKSGCSTIMFDNYTVETVAGAVRERVINELGAFANADILVFRQMVIGFLDIMRSNGSFNDKVYGLYTANEGKDYLISNEKEKWLPGVKAGRNTPRFIYEPTAKQTKKIYNFDLLYYSKYADWIECCATEIFVGKEVYAETARIILGELIKAGLVVPMPSNDKYSVWALDKNKVFISGNVKQLVCDGCGQSVSVSAENIEMWKEARCPRNNCSGTLVVNDEATLGYYGKLFSTGDIVRVSAKEHTGLLERDDREELERIFKHSSSVAKPWDSNVLSCTPTLEMGIDIGDLSSVILCSVPPGQAQFLQRAGRAGRKDGNALVLSVANARPHDLYFYAEPIEMMAGNVEPPKIFLKASAVLERQFVAYCMDCWVKKGVKENAIPKNVSVCISRLKEHPEDIFPFNFLKYVQSNLSSLLRTFLQMFSEELDDNAKEEIRIFAQGNKFKESPMHLKVLESFESLKQQKDALAESIKQLNKLIKELEKKPKDSSYEKEIKELKSEKKALGNVVKNLNNKEVFNFLSDEGLLPNYAFPEAGIILKAILYRKEDNEEKEESENKKRKYERMIYEYNRSASAAISEFAPLNDFYVDGRKLTINQVDLTTSQTAKWRLCPSCSHSQIEETGKDVAACPQCGSPAWADSGQVRTMLKVQMVYSNMDYSKSLIGDESEDRSSKFYCKQLMVDVDEDTDINKAYRMDNEEFAFGYEFVKKATLREINYGEKDINGEKLTVAGNEDVRKGFRICKYCGKIQTEKGKPEHTFTCKSRQPKSGNADPVEECLFLYREFTTEALRLLVPATTMDSSKVRLESFTAAFMLGMKEYFGNVDHLRACLSEVPVPNADYRKQYLVIYDSVPGGTGYLKQLMQNENALIQIFEKALDVLEKCECKKDIQKDGCYHCLYAYRQSQNIGQISRSTAIKILKRILSGKDNVEEIEKLGDVPVNSLFESELERRFIEALSQTGNQKRTVVITKELVKDKEGYLLKVGDNIWEIEPQVDLDEENDVCVKTRADFILWPVRTYGNQKPVAIYTDGFLFHKDKVDGDTLKREAIRRSNKFRVWILSWKDVQSVFKVQSDYATQTLLPENMPSGNMYKPTVEAENAGVLEPEKVTTLELLMNYLEMPDAERMFEVHARAYALSLLEPVNLNNSMVFTDWNYIIAKIIDSLELRDTPFEFGKTFYGKWIPRSSSSHLTILAGVDVTDMQKQKTKAAVIVCAILNDSPDNRTDKYEQEWNGFWHFYNAMQFLPGFAGVTENGMSAMIYNIIPSYSPDVEDANADSDTSEQWTEILEQVFDDEAKVYLNKLITIGVPSPSSVGYELVNSRGAVIAGCELAWEDKKIAFLLEEDAKDIFEREGWKVIMVNEDVDISAFEGGNN
jgi:DEAD/DEAH box helicase domain-containing protein